jgi:hypothetical protein
MVARLMDDLAVRRSAKDIIDNDLRRLADAIRLNTISDWKSFRGSWDQVMSSVRLAMTRPGLSDAERSNLVTLLQEMQQKRQRMDTLGCIEPGRMPWSAQREFIMSVNNWNEFGGVSQSQFRQDHKDLQMLFALHRHDRDAGAEDNAYAKGGVFGGGSGGGSGGGDGAKKCFGCGGEGHVKRDCPKRKKTQDKRRCFNCNKIGHVSSNCPKKSKPKAESSDDDSE